MDLAHETSILYRALASPHGLVVESDNLKLAKAHLYKARELAKDDALKVLSFRTSPDSPHNQIWIVRSTPCQDETTSPQDAST